MKSAVNEMPRRSVHGRSISIQRRLEPEERT